MDSFGSAALIGVIALAALTLITLYVIGRRARPACGRRHTDDGGIVTTGGAAFIGVTGDGGASCSSDGGSSGGGDC